MKTKDGGPSLAILPSTGKRLREASGVGSCILLFAVLLLPSLTAWAQFRDSRGIPWNNPVSATLSTSVWNNWTLHQLPQKQAKSTAVSTPERIDFTAQGLTIKPQ
jgi:hypothetical protein